MIQSRVRVQLGTNVMFLINQSSCLAFPDKRANTITDTAATMYIPNPSTSNLLNQPLLHRNY